MTWVKLFEDFSEIDVICKRYNIKKYTINPDGTVDVNGYVNLNNRRLKELPLKFGRVSGSFYCQHNQLTTLEGSPKEVRGGFYISDNPLSEELLNFIDYKYILKWQDDYGIWQMGKLNQFRWQQMINDYDLG